MPKKNIITFNRITKDYYDPPASVVVHAVSDVSIDVRAGETLAIVGESGSGKSTLARLLMRLEKATSGNIRLHEYGTDRDVIEIAARDFYCCVQMVFQDPYASLNGRKRIWEIVSAGAANLGLTKTSSGRRAIAEEALTSVGLSTVYLDSYPDRLSGGQRQRVSIARALAIRPKVLVLDEPLSALDVSVQSQIINLLLELQERLKLTYLFISHDLAIVRHIADSVAVMRAGRLIEYGPVEEVIDQAQHPYTRTLVSASFIARSNKPTPDGEAGLSGDAPVIPTLPLRGTV